MKLTRKQQARREQINRNIQTVARQHAMDSLSPDQLVGLLSSVEPFVEWAATTSLLSRGKGSIPALVAGMKHTSAKIRATCALLLDHVADDTCIYPLIEAIRTDPQEAVRRCALHSLVCDGCKECPLNTDVIAVLLEVAKADRSLAVRRRAVFYLGQQRHDPRIREALEALMREETDAILLRRARRILER
jgi:HEAT repeat protein